jgi:hypothetical protein
MKERKKNQSASGRQKEIKENREDAPLSPVLGLLG